MIPRPLDDILDDLESVGYSIPDRTDLVHVLDVLEEAAHDVDYVSDELRNQVSVAKHRLTHGTPA